MNLASNSKLKNLGIFNTGFDFRASRIINNESINTYSKKEKINNIYTLAAWNYIASYIIENKTIILDENDMFISFFKMLQDKKTQNLGEKYFQSRLIIYCYLEEEELVKRLKQRVAAGTHPYLQKRNYNDAQIKEMAIKSLNSIRNRLDTLEKHGITILKINTAESLEANTQKIDAFIAKAIEEGRLRE